MVDTGSTDGTAELAASLGARVAHVAWEDDFAAARNASLRMCTGSWIFVIDADERLDARDLPEFRRLLDDRKPWAYRFETRNYTTNPNTAQFRPCLEGDSASRGFPGWFPSTKVRLFPNDPSLEFTGVVHELVNSSLERGKYTIGFSGVPIHHYPLLRTPEALARKAAQYIALGLEKIRRSPEDPKAHVELGNQYADVGDYASAAAAYRAALGLEPANAETLKDLGGVLHLMGRDHEAQAALELAVRLQPDLRDGWRNLGVVHAGSEAWERAARCFRQALRSDPGWFEGHRYLSVALEKAGQADEAAAEARLALERLPQSVEAAGQYVSLMVRLGHEAQARELLETLLVIQPHACGWRWGLERLVAGEPSMDRAGS